MGTLGIQDAGFMMGVNVRIRKMNKYTGEVLEERQKHNRCLRQQLMGIAKFLNGEYNETQPYLQYYQWIPRYLGVGTNIAGAEVVSGITSEVTVNDTRLLNEIPPRMLLPERNTIVNRSTQNYVQLVISTYLPEKYYNDQDIAEAGLFADEKGNNCLFRIAFSPIHKDIESVIEVNWTISIISVDSQNTPYEEVDKVDLRESLNEMLDRFASLHPELEDACMVMKSPGIYEYGRSDSTQGTVDDTTALLQQELNKLDIPPKITLDPGNVYAIEVNDPIPTFNATAFDSAMNVLPVTITNDIVNTVVGKYNVQFKAIDSNGYVTKINREFIVRDTTP